MSDFDERDASDDESLSSNEEEVLEQLQELHLYEPSRSDRRTKVDATPSLLEPPKKLIICATRRPGDSRKAVRRGVLQVRDVS